MRLFRQNEQGNWADVFIRIERELRMAAAESVGAIEKYKEYDSGNVVLVNMYNDLAVGMGKMGRYDEAEDACKMALRCGPKRAETYNTMGAVGYMQGRYDEAIENYRRAIELKPDYAVQKRGWRTEPMFATPMSRHTLRDIKPPVNHGNRVQLVSVQGL
jgi:tetratricopeptide (TPR) repeat protein